MAFIKPPRMLPRFSSFSREDQRFVVDMLARYWATGVPSNPPLAEERDVHRLMVRAGDGRGAREEGTREGDVRGTGGGDTGGTREGDGRRVTGGGREGDGRGT